MLLNDNFIHLFHQETLEEVMIKKNNHKHTTIVLNDNVIHLFH